MFKDIRPEIGNVWTSKHGLPSWPLEWPDDHLSGAFDPRVDQY
jgi:hypothetical protein